MKLLSALLLAACAALSSVAQNTEDPWTIFVTNHPEANYINSWDEHTPSPVPFPLYEVPGNTDGFKYYRAPADAQDKIFTQIQLSKIGDSNTWWTSENLVLPTTPTNGNFALLYFDGNPDDPASYTYLGDLFLWTYNHHLGGDGKEIRFYPDLDKATDDDPTLTFHYRTPLITHTYGDKLYGFKKEIAGGNAQWHTNPTADLSADGATMRVTSTTDSTQYQTLNIPNGTTYYLELDMLAMNIVMHIVESGDPNSRPLYLHVSDSGNSLGWTNDFYLGDQAGVDYSAEVTTEGDMLLVFSAFPQQTNNDWYWHDGFYAPSTDTDIHADGQPITVNQYSGKACYKLTGLGPWIVTARYSDDLSSVTFSVIPKPTDRQPFIWSAPSWNDPTPLTRDENGDLTFSFTASQSGLQYFLLSAHDPGTTPSGSVDDYSQTTLGAQSDGLLTVNSDDLATAILGSSTPFSFKNVMGARYTVKITEFNGSSCKVAVTSPDIVPPLTDIQNQDEGKYWYLSGDINTWSSIKWLPDNMGRYDKDFLGEISHSKENGGGSSIWNPYTTPKEDNGDTYFDYRPEAGQQPARFATIEEMNTLYRFRQALPAEVSQAGLEGDGWLILDLRQTTDAAGNPARLCGQFKFTQGWLEHDAINFSCRVNDLSSPVRAGQLYSDVAYGEEVIDGGVYTFGNNFYLDATYILDPVIYLNPDLKQFFVTGSEHDSYVYYVHRTDPDAPAPIFIDLNSGSQYNYLYPENYGRISEDSPYNWELLPDGADYAYDPLDPDLTVHFDRVWRKKIPSACIHRAPMPFTVSVISAQGTEFTPVRLECDDEWFIEGSEVNLYLRYEDPTMTPAAVYSNSYINVYNDANEIIGQNYQYSDFRPMTPNQHAGPNAPDEFADPNILWFKSAEPVPLKWASGGYALFLSSRGESFPDGGIQANAEERARVALNGLDLYYVIPFVNNPRILYSHLNGTYSISRDGENNLLDTADGSSRQIIQVNAELFHEDHEIWGNMIDTQLDDSIRYSFRIFNESTGDSWQSTDPTIPYYDWDVTEIVPGFYSVIVTVVKDGVTYTARDIYSIAP